MIIFNQFFIAYFYSQNLDHIDDFHGFFVKLFFKSLLIMHIFVPKILLILKIFTFVYFSAQSFVCFEDFLILLHFFETKILFMLTILRKLLHFLFLKLVFLLLS